jgi:hypothetical protein
MLVGAAAASERQSVIRLMPTVDDILPLIGTPLDQRVIEGLFAMRGQKFSDELDPGHPEDQRRYYEIPAYSLEMILGEGDVIDTIFFHVRGKQAGYPWAFRSGLGRASSRKAVLAVMGTPERSGKPEPDDATGCVGYDRFKIGNALVHFEYEADCESVRMITAMSVAAAP